MKEHKVLNDKLWFNRFFDSMIDHHNISNDVYTFDSKGILNPSFNQKNTFDLELLLKVVKYLFSLKSKFLAGKIQNEDFFLPEIEKLNFVLRNQEWYTDNLDFNNRSVYVWSEKIKKWGFFFTLVFKKTKPEKIIFLSYYGFDATSSAMFAANKLNIPTVDVQHGPQTNVHMAYSCWSKLPANGFNTMPKQYWNWDKYSKLNVEKWWRHKNGAIRIGHPWMSYSIDKKKTGVKQNQYLLYTLQIFNEANLYYFFPENVLTLFKSSRIIWHLRIHPRNENNIYLLINFLKSNQIDSSKYIIESSKQVAIYQSLLNSTLHITNYSGCFIEAYILGIESVIIDEIGFDIFSNYLNEENNHYCNKMKDNFVETMNYYINRPKKKVFKSLEPMWNPLT